MCGQLETVAPDLFPKLFRLRPEMAPFETTSAGKHLLAIQKGNEYPAKTL
jgi:hypothetical protein